MKTLRNKRGYTLLLAVIAATLMLVIAAFIVSVARKQFILAASARDSSYAFYAADSGLECAVENFDLGVFTTQNIVNSANSPMAVNCGGKQYYSYGTKITGAAPYYYDSIDPTATLATSTFLIPIAPNVTNSTSLSCAWVKVGFDKRGSSIIYHLESRGYNIGWKVLAAGPPIQGDCSISGPRKVERALRLTYQ